MIVVSGSQSLRLAHKKLVFQHHYTLKETKASNWNKPKQLPFISLLQTIVFRGLKIVHRTRSIEKWFRFSSLHEWNNKQSIASPCRAKEQYHIEQIFMFGFFGMKIAQNWSQTFNPSIRATKCAPISIHWKKNQQRMKWTRTAEIGRSCAYTSILGSIRRQIGLARQRRLLNFQLEDFMPWAWASLPYGFRFT